MALVLALTLALVGKVDPDAGDQSPPVGPTYTRDIAPILDRRCVACHRPEQAGPFALTTYRATAKRGAALAEAVESGRMPPWHADPRWGRFRNDGRLTVEEKALLLGWIEADCPEGDPADRVPSLPRASGWSIAPPDLVVALPAPFTVPAQGVIDYQSFEVDPGFREDRWIQAVEIRPGNRRVVHHATVYLKDLRSHHDLDAQGELGSFCLATTTPGAPALTLPLGMAKRVPAGWRFVFVVHYQPIGMVQTDQTSLGLVFANPSTVRQEVATKLLVAPDLEIPPGVANHRVERTERLSADVLLLGMFPHMHVRGRSFRYEATFPDGRTETLLDVPRFDFNWQNRYELATPRRLPAGTTLRCVAHFDNSPQNSANPDPEATVRAGPQSWDEMFNGYYDIALADQDLTRPPPPLAAVQHAATRFGPGVVAALAGAALWRRRLRGLPRGPTSP